MTDRVPFGVDHIRGSLDRDLIVYPPKVAKKSLRWGWRLCRPDFTSSHDFRWPFPGNWAQAPGPILDHGGDCCREVGDGICAAHTISGAQSNGARMAGSVGLLLAWTDGDVLGEYPDKVRLRRAWVAAVFDPLQHLSGAYLTGADLTGANLTGAYLYGANLSGADLYGADLSCAWFSGGTVWPVGFDPMAAGAVRR